MDSEKPSLEQVLLQKNEEQLQKKSETVESEKKKTEQEKSFNYSKFFKDILMVTVFTSLFFFIYKFVLSFFLTGTSKSYQEMFPESVPAFSDMEKGTKEQVKKILSTKPINSNTFK